MAGNSKFWHLQSKSDFWDVHGRAAHLDFSAVVVARQVSNSFCNSDENISHKCLNENESDSFTDTRAIDATGRLHLDLMPDRNYDDASRCWFFRFDSVSLH